MLIIAVAYLIIMTYGHYDPFYPRNIAGFSDLIHFGDGYPSATIGYQTFSAIITLVLGISSEYLLTLPILVIPLFLISFTLLKRLSKNVLLASILTTCMFIYTAGSSYTVLWIHAHGQTLFILLILVLFLLIRNNRASFSEKIGYTLCALLIIISTNYSSYNYMAHMLILVGIFTAFSILFGIRAKISGVVSYRYENTVIFGVLTLVALTCVFIFNSMYKTALSFISNMFASGMADINKILYSINPPTEAVITPIIDTVSSTSSTVIPTITEKILDATVLLPYYISTETSTPVLGILRYIIILFALSIYGLWILKSFFKEGKLDTVDTFILSVISTGAIFCLIRTFLIGQPRVDYILIPSFIMLARMAAMKENISNISLKKCGYIVSITLLILSLILTVSVAAPKLIDEPKYSDAYLQTAKIGNWANSYSIHTVATDVYSEGAIRLSLSESNSPIHASTLSSKYKVFNSEGRAEIYTLLNPDYSYEGKRDVILNYPLKRIDVDTSDWVELFPWSRFANIVPWSTGYNFVCSIGEIDYLTPSSH
ncbi:MAG: hypothetical protein E7211_19775 [Clostridium lundense]|nr:hypothetical protein [Clostridium lundense]